MGQSNSVVNDLKSSTDESQKMAVEIQKITQEFQVAMMGVQASMSAQDKAFQIQSGMIEKGDKTAEKVGDRIAN